MDRYSSRKWLNESDVSATGSIVTFYGPQPAYGDSRIEPLFELADCHGKVRLHFSKEHDMKNYIKKMRIIAEEATKFADFLETKLED